jgi:hypothetical protein
MKRMRQTRIYLCFAVLNIMVFTINVQAQRPYNLNLSPLKQDVYVQLPLGSIKAKGWLLKQLEQQRDGATGMAEALYPEAENLGGNSDWLGGTGAGWERVPYYVKGLVALAYTLDDAGLKAKAQKYIDWTLDHQQANGAFGPAKMKDWWPRMPMMYALQSYFEATNDKRVIPFLTKYFKYELANLDQDPLKDWGKARAGDNMEIAIWLYNKTGDRNLLKLVEKLKQQAYPWVDIYSNNQFYYFGDDFQPKHMVNVAQALKFPVIYTELKDLPVNRDAFGKGIRHIMQDHGQPEGLGSGTEFLAGTSSIEGVETCTVVEWMQSLETAARVIHEAKIGDQLEKVAFNALPAQFSRDFKNHSYYTLPNQVLSVSGNHGFNQDYATGLISSPYSGYACCRYNMHMGWPYFVKNSVVATPDKGLAIITYGPMEIAALINGNHKIRIKEETNYPFEEQVKLRISLAQAATFPLTLRVPGWAVDPEIRLNGKIVPGVKAGALFEMKRKWMDEDQLVLNFPMQVRTQQQVNKSVSVERGPLVYALEIKATNHTLKTHPVAGFKDYEIRPESTWNYGLVLGSKNINQSVEVVKARMPENPYVAKDSPVRLIMQAKQIPSWGLSYNQVSASEVPFSPVPSTEKTEQITLVPYGSENIRLSCFPVIGKPNKITNHLEEPFNTGLPANWVFYGGGWFWKDGAIHSASNAGSGGYGINGSKIMANGTDFSDFSYEASVTVNSEGDAGLVFRVSNPAIGPEAYQGYYVGINPRNGTVQLGKVSNQVWQVIGSAKVQTQLNTKYNLKIVAKGDRFQVFINGALKPVLTTTDGEYKSGSIGLRAYKAMATFDALKVRAIPVS